MLVFSNKHTREEISNITCRKVSDIKGKQIQSAENKVLRRVFGPERDKVTKGQRKSHNKELQNQYSSPDIFRMTISGGMR
jgi:hypothetical protein